MKAGLLIGFVFLLITATPVAAGEIMVKIANIRENIMNGYSKSEGMFFKNRNVFFDNLEHALNTGVLSKDMELDTGSAKAILDKSFGKYDLETAEQFQFAGRITGRQAPSAVSSWNKLIISFNDSSAGAYLMKIAGVSHAGCGVLKSVAVKNRQGRLERWDTGEITSTGSTKTACVIDEDMLRQKNFQAMFQNMASAGNGLGIMVIRKNSGGHENSDTVLIWIDFKSRSNKNVLPPAASIVLGWGE